MRILRRVRERLTPLVGGNTCSAVPSRRTATRQRGPGLNGYHRPLGRLRTAHASGANLTRLQIPIAPLVGRLPDLADEDRRQQREDECLQKRHEDFEEGDRDTHRHRHERDEIAVEREDQADERE